MKHPYAGLPDAQFWKRAPGAAEVSALDPVIETPFRVTPQDRIVTAGSCFAQHVARRLVAAGFNHHVTEIPHPLLSPAMAERHHYGLFAARYGNLYTARQFRQLIDRALGRFVPREGVWTAPDGRGVVDPFRPQVQPGGYADAHELEADRRQHLAAVRRALEEADVFVFTLGLTEAWVSSEDGAVFPLAPGVAGGRFDPDRHAFRNFDEAETAADLEVALATLRELNPGVRLILTVSPVPLNATFEPRHVLVSTLWSKAVLRVAAERACKRFTDCFYFPSYDIITSPQSRGRYFAEDAREVRPEGVDHVMRVFFRHLAGVEDAQAAPAAISAAPTGGSAEPELARAFELLCDENLLDNRVG